MANLVRNFIKGRMNKSVDERLVPDGEYIDARNIRMGSTEDSEIGTVENTKGNTQLTTLVYPPTGTALSAQATCIGAYSDGANETMYWFVHDPAFTVGTVGKLDLIVSYNTRNDTLTYHVVSIKDATDATRTTLNFDPQNLITGVDLVDGLLFFTDDKNPPRRINVATAYPQPVTNLDYNVLGDDIRVIKAPPLEAPVVTAVDVDSREDYMEDRLLCFGYRWEYANNEYSATSQFSAPIFESKPFAFSQEDYLNVGMENSIQACNVTVRTGSSLVKGIDILFKEMDDSIIRVIQKVNKANSALTDNSDYVIQFSKQQIFTILPESEILRLYDNVPRLAKAQTLMGNRIIYGNYLEGYNLINKDELRVRVGFNATLLQTPLDNDDASIETPEVYSATSLHSNRNYEVGIIYMDEYGRSSTVLTAPNNKVEVDCGQSIFQNQIRVTIPTLMSPPEWAVQYKLAIKSDADLYETIYTNQNFEFPANSGDVYFLLEGENAAKVEKGDDLIVKRDTSGAVTSCLSANVLEKKAYAVGEFDDSTPSALVPAVAGTYMKMRPDFSFGPTENPAGTTLNNVSPGKQSAGTNGGNDQSTENGASNAGDFPYLVYTGFDSDSIPKGTRIRLTMSFTRQGRGDAACETRTLDFDHTWVADATYTDIVAWFYGDPNVTAVIEAAAGVSGDPSAAAPTNQVQPSNSSNASDFGVSGNLLVNKVFFNTHASAPRFVAIGTEKCDGLLGSGSSPNRRSRVDAEWTITRATDVVAFETEPTPALPNLWYESSASYQIDRQNGLHFGNVQDQTNAQPAIVDTAFFNCISYGNGVESYKIRDSVKGKPITLGNRALSNTEEEFSEVRRFADLTYSGVINDETNVNKLNEFNLGLLNFKPLEDLYGPVEKLFGRRTDILTLQEDKISYVLAGKNLLTDATGESVVTSVPEVLGTQVARTEDFGISNNPESFAEWGPHKFFTDAKRGAVIHLFGDGQNENLEVISEKGMRGWFRDEFISGFNTQKLGGYDPYMNEYVLASNDVFLPGQEDCIECNTVQTFLLTAAEQSFCVNLGSEVGPVSISYVIVSADDADTATISTTYPNETTTTPVVSAPISNSSQPAIADVNKNSITDNTVKVDLNYTGTKRFVLQVQVKCPQAQGMNVRLITVNRNVDSRKSIHSEFQWQDGIFVSPLSSTAVTFQPGTDPVISNWQDYTVNQGSNLGPTDGSTVNMIYNRIAPDNYVIRASDSFKYLRTNVNYREADIATILSSATSLTPAGADPEYTADFLMPTSTDEYLYLIWDYSNASAGSGGGDSGGGDSGGGDSGGGDSGGGAVFLLDQTYATGAAAAYSTRRLYSLYTGAAMRIRRDTGAGNAGHDEEADVLFDANGDLNLSCSISNASSGVSATTFGEFVGATGHSDPDSVSSYTVLAYVDTWYDQSTAGATGSGNDAEQSTPGSQPQIYNGSAVITENGKAAVFFDGSNDFMPSANTSLGLSQPSHQFGVGKIDAAYSTSTNYTFGSGSTANTRNHFFYRSTGKLAQYAQSSRQSTDDSTSVNFVFSSLFSGVNSETHFNSSSIITGQPGSYNMSLGLEIGSQNSGNFPWFGNIQEWVIYDSDQSSNRSGIEGNINSHFQIYQPTTQPTSGLLYDYGSATGGTDAAAAYSVRQLSDKAVLCMTVRRDMGVGNPGHDDEITIGFDTNGDLATQAISDFCGTGTGYVSRWWDQSVNGNHAEQSTPGSQPQIYNGSAVITRSSKVSIYFPTSKILHCTTGSTTQPNTSFICADFISGKVIDASSGRRNIEVKAGANIALWSGSSPFTTTTGGGFAGTGDLQLISTILDGSSTTHKLNNATPQTCAAGTGGSTGFYFGGQVGQSNGHLYISEFIAYESDESTDQSDIVTNQNDYFSIY